MNLTKRKNGVYLPKYVSVKKNRYVYQVYNPSTRRIEKEIPLCSADLPPEQFVEIFNNTDMQEISDYLPRKLLTRDEILEASQQIRTETGIYFLVHDNEIVYVGKTKNVHRRLIDHQTKIKKEFTKYHFILVGSKHLNTVEKYYIELLRPKYNVMHKK